MQARFIIYPLNHTILVVDVTEIGSPTRIIPPEGEPKMVPTLRFQSWSSAEVFLLKMGASAEIIAKASKLVAKASMTELTIV